MNRGLSVALVALVAPTAFALALCGPATAADEAGYRYSIDWTTVNTDSWKKYLGDQIHVREIGSQVIVEKKHARSESERVGKPLVHDPTWLKRLRQFSEQNKRKREADREQ